MDHSVVFHVMLFMAFSYADPTPAICPERSTGTSAINHIKGSIYLVKYGVKDSLLNCNKVKNMKLSLKIMRDT